MEGISWNISIIDDHSLLILGGGTKLYLNNQAFSPVSKKVELYSCDKGMVKAMKICNFQLNFLKFCLQFSYLHQDEGMSLELPDLPQEVFGAGISWDNQRSVLYVCGGATWTQAYSNCYSLDLR